MISYTESDGIWGQVTCMLSNITLAATGAAIAEPALAKMAPSAAHDCGLLPHHPAASAAIAPC